MKNMLGVSGCTIHMNLFDSNFFFKISPTKSLIIIRLVKTNVDKLKYFSANHCFNNKINYYC